MIRFAAALLLVLPIAADGVAAEVRDDLGRTVALAEPARRIVTLAPHATELALAAGAAAHLVAIAAGSKPPPGLEGLPRIGGPGVLDREALLALSPDLVIAWHSGNRPADLQWIESAGMNLYRSEPSGLSDIAAAIRAIASLAGTGDSGWRAAQRFEAALETPCSDLALLPAYVQVWERPAMTVGGSHWINEVLRAAGLRNLYEDVERGVFHIAPEAVFATRPAIRVSLLRRFDGSPADRLADLLARPGPRLAAAVGLLCRRRLELEPAANPRE